MSAYQIFQLPKAQPFASGAIIPGARLRFYLTGTTTPTPAYTTSALSVAYSQPVEADAAGIFPAIYLDPTIVYKATLSTAADVLQYTIDPVNDALLSQAVIGQYLYPRTAAEILAGATPVSYAYPAEPQMSAQRYGWSASNTAAQNATAITNAIAALGSSGGVVLLPAGTFSCNTFNIPAQVNVRGAGKFTTRLQNSQTGYFIRLGGNISSSYSASNRKVGVGLSDMSIELSNKDGHALQIMECIGATVERIYSEGTMTASRSNRFVNIDGGNADSFFCSLRDCTTLHYETTFIISTTGTGVTTQVTFDNCTGVGDVSTFPNSIIARILSAQGSGTVFLSCNFEAAGKGIIAENGCQSFSVHGGRFEGNTIDAEAQSSAGAYSLIGCLVNASLITDPGNNISLIGCVNGSNNHAKNTMNGETIHRAVINGEVPLTLEGFAGYTTDPMFVMQNSSAAVVGRWRHDGTMQKVSGISVGTGAAKNIRGQVTLSSGTANVSFASAEPDSAYYIVLGGSANETFRWSSKGTGGFTITSSNAASTADVDWHLFR